MRFVFTINDENHKILKRYSDTYNVSMSTLLNKIIKDSLPEKLDKNFHQLSYKHDELDMRIFKEYKAYKDAKLQSKYFNKGKYIIIF